VKLKYNTNLLKGRKKSGFLLQPFSFLFCKLEMVFFFCKMVLGKLQLLLFLFQNETREDIEDCLACGLFQAFLSKNPSVNTTQIPLSSPPLFTLPAISAFLLPPSHSPASTTQQHRTRNQRLHGRTGYWATGPLQPGQGSILPLSHHHYSRTYSVTRYFAITSPSPGHETARPAASGGNGSVPVLLFKTIPRAHAICGQNKACRHKKKHFLWL